MRTHVIDSVISVARYWYARALTHVLACTCFFRCERG